MKTVGDRIKTRREELGITQEDLAHRLGYKSKSSITKIESGRHNLTPSKIKVIADALLTTPAYIMGWDEEDDVVSKELNTKDDTMSADGYYLNPETAEIAQEIFDDEDLRTLFHVARQASPEQLKSAKAFLEVLKNQEK